MDILEKEKISSIKPVHYTGKTCKSAVSIHAVEIEKELPAQISIENRGKSIGDYYAKSDEALQASRVYQPYG